MISNRELKGQMDQLAEQNQFLTEELEQIKELLKQQANNNQGQQSSNQNSQKAGGRGESQGGGGSCGTHGSGGSKGRSGSNGSGNSGISDLANDFSKLKDLTSQLEDKMYNYIAGRSSSKPMSDEDAVNLILTMMNGMIDWSMDLLSRSSDSSNQQQ